MTHILYIEDNEDSAFMLELWLKKNGFTVTIAPNAEEGLEIAPQLNPALVIMDLSLPKMDGLEATKILKSRDTTSHIPIIILTTRAMVGDKERALSTGADDYDTKPIDFPHFFKKINQLINHE